MARTYLPPIIRHGNPAQSTPLFDSKGARHTTYLCIPITGHSGQGLGASPMEKALVACNDLTSSGYTNRSLAEALIAELTKQAKEV
jgi:hypothetical protein